MMKLFAWQPDGHGQQSFFVMAENESQAFSAVEAEIQRLLSEKDWFSSYDYAGWGTDYYKLTIADVGEVIANDNS
jgi:hypothetical protein